MDNELTNLWHLRMAAESIKNVFLSGGVPYGKELTESWAALQTRIKAGNFAGIHVGDFKTITLTTGETVVMEVAGIDQYYRCGNIEIGHHVDFISRDCLADNNSGKFIFNDGTSNNNGTAEEPNPWMASKLFRTMNDETSGVYATLPSDLKPCIIEKRANIESRYSDAGMLSSSTGFAWNNMGKLWLPTEIEVFGCNFKAGSAWTLGGGCNLQYPIFIGGAKHIIKGNGNGGNRANWREANATNGSSGQTCGVSIYGDISSFWTGVVSILVPLCFRIG